ncbi:hypothetical protein [Paenibacillus odorifer]|uniref:hypothetical protein n=1 Tax=Paenibacillus odorifer TaxID=189426 RepID=UPI0015C2F573|nr:hypothetical protein [Paenibacillus odorifer]
MKKSPIALSITILLFVFAVIVFVFMEKNIYNIVVGVLAVAIALYNLTATLRKR